MLHEHRDGYYQDGRQRKTLFKTEKYQGRRSKKVIAHLPQARV